LKAVVNSCEQLEAVVSSWNAVKSSSKQLIEFGVLVMTIIKDFMNNNSNFLVVSA